MAKISTLDPLDNIQSTDSIPIVRPHADDPTKFDSARIDAAKLLDRANHTGSQPLATLTETDQLKVMTADERTKTASALQPNDAVSKLAETDVAKIMTADERRAISGLDGRFSAASKANSDVADAVGKASTFGAFPATAGIAAVNLNDNTVYRNIPLGAAGYLTKFSISSRLAIAGSLYLVSMADGAVQTVIASTAPFNVGAAPVTIDIADMLASQPVTPDLYLGFRTATPLAVDYIAGAEGFLFHAGGPAAGTAIQSQAGFALCMGWEITSAVAAGVAQAKSGVARLKGQLLGTSGLSPATAGTGPLSAGITVLSRSQFGSSGQAYEWSFWSADAVADARLAAYRIVNVAGVDNIEIMAMSDPMAITVGLNTPTAFQPYVDASWWPAVYSSGRLHYLNGTAGYSLRFATGLPSFRSPFSINANQSFQIGVKVRNGGENMAQGEAARAKSIESLLRTRIEGTSNGIFGPMPAVAQASHISAGYTVLASVPITKAGAVGMISAEVGADGPGTLMLVTRSGSNPNATTTLVASTPVMLDAGVNPFWWPQDVTVAQAAAGNLYVALCATNLSVGYTASGPGTYYCQGLPGVATALQYVGGSTAQIGVQITDGIAPQLASNGDRTKAIETKVDGTVAVTMGVFPAVAQPLHLAAGYTAWSLTPISASGTGARFPFEVGAAGPVTLYLATRDAGGNVSPPFAEVDYLAKAGPNTPRWPFKITPAQAAALNLYPGVYALNSGLGFTAVGAGLRYNAGKPSSSVATATLPVGNATAAIGVEIISGANPRLANLESIANAERSKVASLQSGVAQAQTDIATLQANVSPVSADRVRRVRAALAPQIGTGSPVSFIGDSLFEGQFYPTTLHNHFIERVFDLLNAGFADGGEVGCTILFPDANPVADPAWYGITGSGGTLGSAGSVGRSLILADGESRTFSGNLGVVEAFVVRAAGGGNLVRTIDGGSSASFATTGNGETITNFGGVLPSAVSTYVLTASGGPVEITDVVRIAKDVQSGPIAQRGVRFLRNAFGGYRAGAGSQASTSFTNARLDSVIAHAKALGPAPRYVVGLMTNDWLFGGYSSATFAAEVTRIISKLKADGAATAVDWLLPSRPLANALGGSLATYAVNGGFDEWIGAADSAIRLAGGKPLHLSPSQFVLYADGLHWTDADQVAVRDRLLEHWARDVI